MAKAEEEKEEEATEKEAEEEEATIEATPEAAPSRPPTVVQIRTPLDRPEFDYFLTTFMKKMGLKDKTQAAITLTNMFYDMGLDPYADLKDVQQAMHEMNLMLKGLPDTPVTTRVKDTVGGIIAARTGRAMLQRVPRIGGQDAMMDRMERIMDKYMPLIASMRMIGETMRMEPSAQTKPAEVPESLKNELGTLKQELAEIKGALKSTQEAEKEKLLAESIVKTINAQVMPLIKDVQTKVEALSQQVSTPPPPVETERSETLDGIRKELQAAVDKMGEVAGAKQVTLQDVDALVGVIEKLEKFYKKEPAGEFDWKAQAISAATEIGKEFVSAVKEIETSKASSAGTQQVMQPAPPSVEMQNVIKRQVQNYIMQRLKTGAATMNLKECAQALGLTVQQVAWAYQTLMAEGWIYVRTAAPSSPETITEKKVKTSVQTQTETEQTTETSSEDQAFVET